MLVLTSCITKQTDKKTEENFKYPDEITFELHAQNPEGIEYNREKGCFLISAINETPNIATTTFTGEIAKFSNSQELNPGASFGLEIDYKNQRLLACTNTSEFAGVVIYNLNNGNLEHTANLSQLLAKGTEFQANDLVVDGQDVYITGRLENTIYKLNESLESSIFYSGKRLDKPNGIVLKDGYLIVVNYTNTTASLVKIPLKNPELAKTVEIQNFDFKGMDGMLFTEEGSLLGVAKNFENSKKGYVLEFVSNDDWNTARLVNKFDINRSTTIAKVSNKIYYVLNQDWKTPKAKFWTLEKVEMKKRAITP